MPETATVSVVVSGLVALGVPLLIERIQSERRSAEVRHARYDELRDVLDDASTALMRLWQLFPDPRYTPEEKALRDQMPAARIAVLECWLQDARVAMRTGHDSDLCRVYGTAHTEMSRVQQIFQDIAYGREPKRDLDATVAAAWDAINAFFDVAAAYVGAERNAQTGNSPRPRFFPEMSRPGPPSP